MYLQQFGNTYLFSYAGLVTMGDISLDAGFPFELQSLWLSSTLTLEPEQGSLFLPPDLGLPTLLNEAESGTLQNLDDAPSESIDAVAAGLPELESIGGEWSTSAKATAARPPPPCSSAFVRCFGSTSACHQ